MFSTPNYTPRVHDLLLLKPGSSAETEAANPKWVRAALIKSRFVVLRREAAPPGMIAVGVRGPSRNQRWAGFVMNEDVHRVIGPGVLRSRNANSARRSLPAIETLRYVEAKLRTLTLEWGPVGSVGYELATGLSVTRLESDLDLVIYAPQPVLRDEVRCFWNIPDTARARIDVRLESPAGGFSLEEYVRDGQDRVLLRTSTGPILTDDPWRLAERITLA